MENEMDKKALELDEMNGVAGGYQNDPETCPHDGGFNIQRQARNMGRDGDWGYRVQMQKFYICKLCGKTWWEDQFPG